MYSILFFILYILLFVLFFILKNNFKRKEIFLQKNVEQLDFEKEVLEDKLKKSQEKNTLLEKELLKSNKKLVEMQAVLDRVNTENESLRKLISELQKSKGTKNDDITIEYLVQK
jgi:septal ring factor EnvC (AmiA/AmiB activator)